MALVGDRHAACLTPEMELIVRRMGRWVDRNSTVLLLAGAAIGLLALLHLPIGN
jgi:hypothetical protein